MAVIKTVALVGGTSGLGYKIAKVLLSDDFKVVLLTREESQVIMHLYAFDHHFGGCLPRPALFNTRKTCLVHSICHKALFLDQQRDWRAVIGAPASLTLKIK